MDHTRIKLGQGEEVFLRAKAALGRWEQFRLGWVEAWPPQATIEAGGILAVVAHVMGLCGLNACRIVYVVDEPGPVSRYGFTHGTLPDHAGTGEERFVVEWDRARGEVRCDILAFSRPHQFLTRLGYRYLRRLQKRFGEESAGAMVRAVKDDAGRGPVTTACRLHQPQRLTAGLGRRLQSRRWMAMRAAGSSIVGDRTSSVFMLSASRAGGS